MLVNFIYFCIRWIWLSTICYCFANFHIHAFMTDDKNYSINQFEKAELEHLNYFTDFLSNEINLFEKNINFQSFILNGCLAMFTIYPYSAVDSIVLQAHIKSVYLLYNAHKLTLQGNQGIAKSLFRQIFEYQLISKYFHMQNNDEEAEKWLDNRQFDVFDKVLKKLVVPSKKNLSDFWRVLCTQAHATTTSCQVLSEIDENRAEIKTGYHMILLLTCLESYSLEFLCQRKKIVRLKRLIGNELYNELSDCRQDLKEVVKSTMLLFSDEGNALISDYKSKWTFR